MKNLYTLLQLCEVWGEFKKDGEDISYKYTKAWFAVENVDDTGETTLRYTKEYKLSPSFAGKVGAKSENLLFDDRGRLYALT